MTSIMEPDRAAANDPTGKGDEQSRFANKDSTEASYA